MGKTLIPIFLVVLVDIFGMTLVIPLLAIYSEHFGATPAQATLLTTVYALCQLIAAPIIGALSDRYGRRRLLLISQAGTFIGFLIMARATSLWMLFLARAIDGATAGNLSLAQAYISDNTAPKDRARSFAIIGVSFGLGFFIGPFLTGYLVNYGMTAPIHLASVMSATSILFTFFLLPSGREARVVEGPEAEAGAPPAGRRLGVWQIGRYTEYFRRPLLSGLLWQFFLYLFCFTTFTSGFALFAERRLRYQGHPFGPREIGYLFGYVGFLGILLQGGILGRLVKRVGEAPLARSGFAALTLAYTALGFVQGVGPLVALSTVSAYGNGVLRPTLTSLITQRAGRSEQGAVLGLTSSLQSLSAIVAPLVVGQLIQRGLLSQWAFLAAGTALVGLLVSVRIHRAGTPPEPVSEER